MYAPSFWRDEGGNVTEIGNLQLERASTNAAYPIAYLPSHPNAAIMTTR